MRISIWCMMALLLWMTGLGGGLAQSQNTGPTGEVQLMLELINRARMDPPAEGIRLAASTDRDIIGAYRFFNVDLNALVRDFTGYPPRPPLAMNALLRAAAFRHSDDMLANNYQGHVGTDGTDVGDRVTDTGYEWMSLAENVYSYGKSIEYSHAGFVVDWGVPDLGHRHSTLEYDREPRYVEIGISILHTSGTQLSRAKRGEEFPVSPGMLQQQINNVGPLVVTIVFGRMFNVVPILLGVVYDDRNGNQFYDVGEGLGQVNISLPALNLSVATDAAGGYAIPIPTSGDWMVEASGGLLSGPVQKMFHIDTTNVKVDFLLQEAVAVDSWKLY